MEYTITGDNLQMVTCTLSEGEKINAEAGSMVNMSGNVKMDSHIVGGVLKGIKRTLTGESFFLTTFTPENGNGFVSFAGNAPGKIFVVHIDGPDFIAQKDAFLCSEQSVSLDIAFTKKLTAGLFGGEGFILQRYCGEGFAFLHCCGDILEKTLGPGEVIRVETGLVVGFEESVSYSIDLAGGVKTVLFGGEGLFLTTLTGPGKVILQSMNLRKLANSLVPFLPKPTSGSS